MKASRGMSVMEVVVSIMETETVVGEEGMLREGGWGVMLEVGGEIDGMGERLGDVYREWMDMDGLYGVDDVGRLLFSFMSFISFISYMLRCGSYTSTVGRPVSGTSCHDTSSYSFSTPFDESVVAMSRSAYSERRAKTRLSRYPLY